jgi:pyrroline-5-carboxylate reductase
MAGVTLRTISQGIDSVAYCRAMPNVAALYGSSMTTITGDEGLKEVAQTILETIGQTVWLKSEKELDIATALAGSGPAYMMLVAESLADGAVAQGLSRADALKLTQGLFEGSAALLKGDHPAVIKDRVMSPGGTTAAGYGALEAKGVRGAFMDAIKAAYRRAQELA